MKRDLIFYSAELGEYVTISADVQVNIGIDRDIVNIVIPRINNHYRVRDIMAKDKFRRPKK